jgi:hypothetical protein
MDDNLPGRVQALEERVLQLEAGHRAPLSHLDRIIADDLHAKRQEPHEEARRRLEEYRAAQAEAERVGSDQPVDDFWRKIRAGALQPPISRPSRS